MELLFGVLIGLVILVLLVVVHELGHAIAARRNGVVVEEFGIGFPPRAWAKKLKNGVLFTLNWLPLGGFVKLQGEHDSADQPGDYGAATFWQKTKILLAGVMMNWLIAAGLILILAVTGLPKLIPDQVVLPFDSRTERTPVLIGEVTPEYPAANAGLQAGDTIVEFAGEPIETSEELIDISRRNKGETVSMIYERDGSQVTVEIKLRDSETSTIGAILGQSEQTYSTWSAPLVGVATTAQLSWETIKGVGGVVAGLSSGVVMQFSPDQSTRDRAKESLDQVGNSVAGPIGILGVIFPEAQKAGLGELILLTAVISLTLAVMNILPIPALDGGRWFTMVIFRLIRKPLTKEREEKIQAIGFMTLMALIVLVTFSDIIKVLN